MKTSDQMTGEEYMGLIDQYAAATLTGMLALSGQQEDFGEEDLHQACDTAFTIARIMVNKRDAIVKELSQQT
jgi:hypothetical protein